MQIEGSMDSTGMLRQKMGITINAGAICLDRTVPHDGDRRSNQTNGRTYTTRRVTTRYQTIERDMGGMVDGE